MAEFVAACSDPALGAFPSTRDERRAHFDATEAVLDSAFKLFVSCLGTEVRVVKPPGPDFKFARGFAVVRDCHASDNPDAYVMKLAYLADREDGSSKWEKVCGVLSSLGPDTGYPIVTVIIPNVGVITLSLAKTSSDTFVVSASF